MSIEIRGLNIAIGTKPIVRDVCMGIADGERVGLVGSSGSGKSMIAKALMGLLPDTARISGSIMVGGKQTVASDWTYRHGRFARALYGHGVPESGCRAEPGDDGGPAGRAAVVRHYDLSLDERLDRVKAMLDKVGLPGCTAEIPTSSLSGGQQQRVGIATALITSPRFIIADEPTTALDSITQRQIVDLLTSLVDDARARPCCSSPMISRCSHAPLRAVMCWTAVRGNGYDRKPIAGAGKRTRATFGRCGQVAYPAAWQQCW